MRLFRGRGEPKHAAAVAYVYERHSDLVPYYTALCKCGWFAEPVTSSYPDPGCEQQMAAAALAHDPAADTTTVTFPLDDPHPG